MNRHKRQDQILNIALKVFARDGYKDPTISQLVTEAGVSRGTFYLYFQCKKDILDCLLDRFLGELLIILSRFKLDSLAKNGTYDASLAQTMAHDLSLCLAKNKPLAKLIWTEATTLDIVHQEKITNYIEQYFNVIEHQIEHGIQTKTFKKVDTTIISRCFIGAIKEITLAKPALTEKTTMEEQMSHLICFLLDGLLADNRHKKDAMTSDATQETQQQEVYATKQLAQNDYC